MKRFALLFCAVFLLPQFTTAAVLSARGGAAPVATANTGATTTRGANTETARSAAANNNTSRATNTVVSRTAVAPRTSEQANTSDEAGVSQTRAATLGQNRIAPQTTNPRVATSRVDAPKLTAPTVSARATTTPRTAANRATVTSDTIAETTAQMTALSDLNTACIKQYGDCMDQFCNVLDTNAMRCTCSDQINNYQKTADSVQDANDQLNDVAQRIRYVGLSADEIHAIMSETEGEAAMDGQKDNTENRSLLDSISALIKDPTTSGTATTNDSGLGILDLNFGLDGTGTDVSDMFNIGDINDLFGTSSSSFTNTRGDALRTAAAARCKNILDSCAAQGASSANITANYDMQIDHDCIAYSAGLDKMNATLKTNVRAATQMLQTARLTVLQNKNQYDATGCIDALNTCMTDDMVCGADYTKCLDPTKTYIDENGSVVLGQNITNITAIMQNFDASNINLQAAQNVTISTQNCMTNPNNNGNCIIKYLLDEIGTGQTATGPDSGLCRAVLDKCEDYTYEDGKYNPFNDIVLNFVQHAMISIKAGQQTAISKYASSCMSNLATCYNQQVSQITGWTTAASVSSVQQVMKGACRNVALTCAFAVFADDSTHCDATTNLADTANVNLCINNISDIFFQSMLCTDPNAEYVDPDNGDVVDNGTTVASGTIATMGAYAGRVFVNEKCLCMSGFGVYGGVCVNYPENSQPDPNCTTQTTTCVIAGASCNDGYAPNGNGQCVKIDTTPTNPNPGDGGGDTTPGCRPGYYLSDGACYQCANSTNVMTWAATPECQIATCQYGYELYDPNTYTGKASKCVTQTSHGNAAGCTGPSNVCKDVGIICNDGYYHTGDNNTVCQKCSNGSGVATWGANNAATNKKCPIAKCNTNYSLIFGYGDTLDKCNALATTCPSNGAQVMGRAALIPCSGTIISN